MDDELTIDAARDDSERNLSLAFVDDKHARVAYDDVKWSKASPSPFTVVASPPPSALLLLLLLLLLLTLATGGASEAALEGAGDVRPLCFREACVRHL